MKTRMNSENDVEDMKTNKVILIIVRHLQFEREFTFSQIIEFGRIFVAHH